MSTAIENNTTPKGLSYKRLRTWVVAGPSGKRFGTIQQNPDDTKTLEFVLDAGVSINLSEINEISHFLAAHRERADIIEAKTSRGSCRDAG